MKFGKKPARPDAVKLKFADVLNVPALPTPPIVFGHESLVPMGTWGMLGNDSYGDCVWAGAAHEHMLWEAEGSQAIAQFTEDNVLSDYSALTGFSKYNPFSDQGTDMVAAAAYRQKTGVIDAAGNRHKIDAYAALKVGDTSELALATYIFGAVGFGLVCPDNLEDQFTAGQVWDGGNTTNDGHYVPCVGRNSAGNFVFVSWGKLQAATPAWVEKWMDEGLCYLDLEFINSQTKVSRENFNLDLLSQYLKEV